MIQGQRERREQRARHAERHGQDVDHEAAHQLASLGCEAEAAGHRPKERLMAALGHLRRRLRGDQKDAHDHGEEGDDVERVGPRQPDGGDDDATNGRPDHEGELDQPVVEGDGRAQTRVPHEVWHDGSPGRAVDGRPAGGQAGQREDERERWAAMGGAQREPRGGDQHADLGEQE